MKSVEYMKEALTLAGESQKKGEIPVGAVVVKDGEIIGRGYNFREKEKSPIGHAEIMAITAAAKTLGDWRLNGCDIYVTLEPCPMCAGAIINSRIDRVFFGALDKEMGCFGSKADFSVMNFGTGPEIHAGIMENECKEILKEFFKNKRK